MLFRIPAERFAAYIGCSDYYKCRRSVKVSKVHFPFNSSGHIPKRWIGDAAVLVLAERLNFSALIQPLCLVLEFRERIGEYAFFAGYGQSDAPNGTFANLYRVQATILQFRPIVDCRFR
ncbi:hypothetical protein AAVH_12228 [Aphelenchoides avenae]|nr:hypothetical protein AAVH_12228 [Aphelenchus avenae]